MDSEASQQQVAASGKRAVVAVDLGTSFSGHAFCFVDANGKRRGDVWEYTDWPEQPAPYAKTLSAILYRNDQPLEWGWSAQRRFLAMSPEEQHQCSYVQYFKLALQNEDDPLGRLPVGLSAKQVLADFLYLLKGFIVRNVREVAAAQGIGTITDDQIQWVMGYPELLGPAARLKMRRAAERSGMQADSLLFATEPDLASLYGMEAGGLALHPGQCFMVVDAGGGTVDISMHDVVLMGQQPVLSEHTIGSSVLAGSSLVDRALERWLRGRLGPGVWDEWKAAHVGDYLWLLGQWEAAKRRFAGPQTPGGDAAAGDDVTLRLPASLAAMLPAGGDASSGGGSSVVASGASGGGSGVVATSVQLDAGTASSLFDEVLDPAIQEVLDVLARAQRAPECVMLAGGFGESPYLMTRMQAALESAGVGPLVVLPNAGGAVLQGGIISGVSPQALYARRSRLTYGVSTCRRARDDDPPDLRFWHKEKSDHYTRCVFDPFVVKGELVPCGERAMHTFTPLYAHQMAATFPLLATDAVPVQGVEEFKAGIGPSMFATDAGMYKVGEVELSWDGGAISAAGGVDDYDLKCEFMFGGAELRVESTDVQSGHRASVALRFAHETVDRGDEGGWRGAGSAGGRSAAVRTERMRTNAMRPNCGPRSMSLGANVARGAAIVRGRWAACRVASRMAIGAPQRW